ncbi:MAG: class II aldolase/adducin family protein [Pseudomonadota bacterium]
MDGAAATGTAPLDHVEERRDLAAAFRWFARLGMNEGIANHFSLAVSPDGATFLMNPYGFHWSQLCASDLLLLDAHEAPGDLGERVDITAWAIHGAMHRKVPHARCIMHLHPRFSTALACLKDPSLPPIDQNSMRFFNRVAIDMGFDGMGLGDEAERLAGMLGNRSMMMMAQHGVLAAGPSAAACLDDLYYFEKAAETYMTALATGRALNVASDTVAEKTARQWEAYPGAATKHLSAIRAVLDREEPDYAS